MSNYYGNATLEDWLYLEVFSRIPDLQKEEIVPEIVELFESWRADVESNIESWIFSDDGYGNRLSWRGWGRGYYAIPQSDDAKFGATFVQGENIINKARVDKRPSEVVTLGHKKS